MGGGLAIGGEQIAERCEGATPRAAPSRASRHTRKPPAFSRFPCGITEEPVEKYRTPTPSTGGERARAFKRAFRSGKERRARFF